MLSEQEIKMTQIRQYWVWVRYKDEPGAGFGKQYVTATNSYEAIQMAKALYGKLLMYEVANPV
jgi:hypothetical protein